MPSSTTQRKPSSHPTTSRASRRMRAKKEPAPASIRGRLLRRIRKAPGLPLSGLLTGLGMGWSSLYEEVEALEESGLVVRQKRGRHVLVYPAGQQPTGYAALPRTVLLQGKTVRRIAQCVIDGEGWDMESIAKHLGLSSRVVYYHLARLVNAHLLKSESKTRYKGLTATPNLRNLLDQIQRRDRAAGVA